MRKLHVQVVNERAAHRYCRTMAERHSQHCVVKGLPCTTALCSQRPEWNRENARSYVTVVSCLATSAERSSWGGVGVGGGGGGQLNR